MTIKTYNVQIIKISPVYKTMVLVSKSSWCFSLTVKAKMSGTYRNQDHGIAWRADFDNDDGHETLNCLIIYKLFN